jgi:hypothetical protein
MKKVRFPATLIIAIAVAVLSISATASAPVAEDSGAADVVVLLDTSQSVLPYFQDVTDFVLSSVVKDFLRFGDTFHLLTFGDSAQSEIAQKMSDERDIKSVLGRLYLLYPLARHSDFLGALGYLGQYLSDLPESRRKVVVVITDGVQNPPPGSPSAAMESSRVVAEIESTCSSIRAKGWDLHLIRLPFVPDMAAQAGAQATGGRAGAPAASAAKQAAASAGAAQATTPSATEAAGTSYFDVAAKALGGSVAEFSADGKEDLARRSLALPTIEFPTHLGKRGYSFSFPLKVENGSDAQIGLELEALSVDGVNILEKKSFLKLQPDKSGVMDVRVSLPDTFEPGEKSFTVGLSFANGVRVSPQSGILSFTLARAPLAAFFRGGARIVLFAVLLLLVLGIAFAIVALARRVPKRAEAPIVAAVLDSAAERDRSAVRARQTTATAASASGLGGPAAAIAVASSTVSGTVVTPARAADQDERDAAVLRAADEFAKASKAESARSADILAEAAARKSPAAALAEFAASHALPAKAKTAAAAPKTPKTGAPVVAEANRDRVVVRPGSLRVELRVEGQNPNIGSRNVHTLHAGAAKTVGGGRSDFLVFLVPTSKRAAELHYDGEKLRLVPLKPELFPATEGPIEDCLDRDILMLGKNAYPLVLRFIAYERPADKINRLLHCIETPGLTSLDFEP